MRLSLYTMMYNDNVCLLLYKKIYNDNKCFVIHENVFLLYMKMYFYYTRRCISIIQDDV